MPILPKMLSGAVLGLLAVLAGPAGAQEGDAPRFALVVGNADYDLGDLRNPINDARSVAAVLLETGFKVSVVEDATQAQFETAVGTFLDGLPEGSVALFYYAGHALQRDGRNYLLPVDVRAGTADSVVGQSINASELIERFHARKIDFGIFILDACRDNPFIEGEAESGRGLASMESQGGETLIAFSTQAGEVAYDGTGPNSPYTGALVTEIDKPGRDILDVFKSVRRSVRIWTNGQQRPFISASIERSFAFRPASSGVAEVELDTAGFTAATVRPSVERIWWAAIADSRLPEDFRRFVDQFPESGNASQARDLAVGLEQSGVQVRGLVLVQFNPDAPQPDPKGLSAVVTSCDIIAGDPDDPRRITDGVAWGLVNVRRAVVECSDALARDPTNPRLQHLMGRLLDIQGRYDEAEAFYRLAGSADYSASLVNLGFMYVTARGRERDYGEAMQLYRRAADLGNLRARTNIGEMFQRGWSVTANADEAVLWYRLAAQNGWPNALSTLGNMYRNGRDDTGRGVDKDIDEAIRLWRIAAELQSTDAMNSLGQVYLSGEVGGEPQVEEGLRWLTLAAEKGNRFAPFNLGRVYREGKLVERDYDMALAMFERAADFGFAPARVAIGDMYLEGQGVEKSREEAAFQFMLALLTADDKRPEQSEDAQKRLDELALDAAGLDAARARAEEWLRLNGG